VTHDNNFLQAIIVDSAHEILKTCDNNPTIKVIAIDEAQFFLKEEDIGANLVEACQILKKHGYRIILTGLDMDALGQPFGLMPQLLAIADDILKLRSVCVVCGADASMTFRFADIESQVELGSTDKYQARCFSCWKDGMLEKQGQEVPTTDSPEKESN
jgi:thymidine kinase